MKLVRKILIVILLLLIILPFKVNADKVMQDLVLNIYDNDFAEKLKSCSSQDVYDPNYYAPVECAAFSFLSNEANLILSEKNNNGDVITVNFYLASNNKNLFSATLYTKDNSIKFDTSALDQYTLEDNFVYTIDNDAREIIENNYSTYGIFPLNTPLSNYDRIIVNLSDMVEPKGDVYISRIRLQEKNETTTIGNNPIVDGLKLDLDLQFKNVGDYEIYRVGVVNNTDKEYQISDTAIYGSDNYVKYEFSFEDNSNILKPNVEKIMYIKASYDKEVPEEVFAASGGSFTENKKLEVELINETGDVANPKTSDNLMTSIIVIMISIALIIVMIKVQALRKTLMIVLAGIILIPTIANAIEKLNITINAKVEIKNPHMKFCVYTNTERTEKEYYDYIDGTAWNEYYDSHRDLPLFEHYSNLELYFYHYEYEQCIPDSLPNPYSNTNEFDTTGISPMSPIDCFGREYMPHESKIISSEYGCYVGEIRYYE